MEEAEKIRRQKRVFRGRLEQREVNGGRFWRIGVGRGGEEGFK